MILPRIAGFLLVAAALAPALEPDTKPFTPAQKRLWSLQPVVKPAEPGVTDSKWPAGRIDRFVLASLEGKGLRPNPPADPVTLLRRVSLDLTGLPPSPEEVQAFLSDRTPSAYRDVVERLLASPRYGERWARHWLDLARYADSEGFKSDETRPNVWRYRDYVIRSFNADKPYNRFVEEQLAGDELFPGEVSALVATGFNRHFPDEYNARNLMQRRQEWLNDITDTVGAVFLGMTFGCARCHDHKFDPILQKDYYRLQAFFAAAHSEDKIPLLPPDELARYRQLLAAWEEKTAPVRAELTRLIERPRRAMYQDEFEKYPENIQKAVTTPPESRDAFQWQMFYQSRILLDIGEEKAAARLKGEDLSRYRELKRQLSQFDSIKPADPPLGQTMIETGTAPPATHVLTSGAWDAPGEVVQPGFLTILAPGDAAIRDPGVPGKTGRRAALAKWITDPANPLTARVIVNRVWNYHLGRGIVGTPSDFGLMGERPTHRELLDDLAGRFVENGWSLKWLHREIVLSATYRQASTFREEAAKVDAGNRLLWRFDRRRVEGEALRDSMLQVSGVLNLQMYGPGVFPPLPAGVVTRGGWKSREEIEETRRRSIYVFVRRNTRYPMFETFDFPDSHESCARRNTTVTPMQALELLNDDLILDWSRSLAARVLNDSGMDLDAQIDRAWRLAYSRSATPDEHDGARRFLSRQTRLLAGKADPQREAFVDLCHSLLVSNEFMTVN